MSEPIKLAQGLAWALGHIEDDGTQGGQRRRGPDPRVTLREWMTNGARTRLGRMVVNGEITTFEQAVASRLPIREPEIIDAFMRINGIASKGPIVAKFSGLERHPCGQFGRVVGWEL